MCKPTSFLMISSSQTSFWGYLKVIGKILGTILSENNNSQKNNLIPSQTLSKENHYWPLVISQPPKIPQAFAVSHFLFPMAKSFEKG
jgi:hypothetical protein